MIVGRDGEFFLLDFRWKPDRSRSMVAVEPLDREHGWRANTFARRMGGKARGCAASCD